MLYVSCAGAVCVCVYVADYLIWSCVRAVVDKGVDASGLKIRNGKLAATSRAMLNTVDPTLFAPFARLTGHFLFNLALMAAQHGGLHAVMMA